MKDLFLQLKNLKYKKGILFTWYLSCFAAIFALLCVFGAAFLKYDAKLNEETLKLNEYVFNRTADSINSNLYFNNLIQTELSSNESLAKIKEIKDGTNYFSNHDVNSLVEKIKQFSNAIPGRGMIYIYFKSTDYILSSHGVLPSKDFYELYFTEEEMTYAKWIGKLKNSVHNEYNLTSYKSTYNIANAVENIFHVSQNDDSIVCVIMTDKSAFMGNVNDIKMLSMCDIYLYTEFGKLLISDINSGVSKNNIPKNLNELNKMTEDKKNVVFINPLPDNEWVVAAIVPQKLIEESNRLFRTYMLCVVLIVLIVFVIFVDFMIKKSYTPIEKIFSMLKIDENNHRYDNIYRKLDYLLENDYKLKKNIDEQTASMREFALSRLMHGDVEAYNDSCENQIINQFKHEYFATVIFYAENLEDLFQNSDITTTERKNTLRLIIENIFTELYSKENIDICFTEVDSNMVGLINLSENTEETQKIVNSVVKNGVGAIEQNFEMTLLFTSSDIHKGILNISVAYEEALKTLKTVMLYDLGESMIYDSSQNNISMPNAFSIGQQQNLINCLKMGDLRQTLDAIDSIFGYLTESKIRADYSEIIFYDVVNTLVKCSVELVNAGYKIKINNELYQIIQSGASVENIFLQIRQYAEEICRGVNEYDQSENRLRGKEKRLKDIIAFVDEHYTNPLLNISYIANEFGLGASYVSKIFKDAMKKNLMEYINEKRILKAKNLMETTDDSLEIIAAKAGFNHIRTFYRVHKKYKEAFFNGKDV